MYLISPGTLQALMQGNPNVLEKFEEFEAEIVMSSLVALDCYNAASQINNQALLSYYKTLFGSYKMLNFGNSESLIFARLKYDLQKSENVLSDFELMLASQALAQNCTLVTVRTKTSGKLPNLELVDWTLNLVS